MSTTRRTPRLSSTGAETDVTRVRKIVAGGQTGADRAALDWAIAHGVPHGGWCPRGRRADDGRIAEYYALTETPRRAYVQRTEWNVRDSDGTLLVTLDPKLRAGSKRTAEFAKQYRRPCLHVSQTEPFAACAEAVRRFLREQRITVLNVAGPRASEAPQVGEFVGALLDAAWDSGDIASGG
ncbi:MAG TPA: putative molybdenum carrier protein [Chthoniobacteraceae bacterium]|nr:putative molybdenum carrier protein [Chthoniobacteraceae bacterium]